MLTRSQLKNNRSLWGLLMILLLWSGCSREETAQLADQPIYPLTVSSTVELASLAQSWAEAYSVISDSGVVLAKGSGFDGGFEELLRGEMTIFASHYPLEPEVMTEAVSRGLKLLKLPVARDGVALIVKTNSIVEIMHWEDVGDLFSGEINSWDSFSQRKGVVQLFVDETDSLRNAFFMERVLQNREWSPHITWVSSQQSVIDSVKEVDNSMGMVAISSTLQQLNHVKILSFGMENDELVTLFRGPYPLSYLIYFYVDNSRKSAAEDFINFCLSKDGRRIVIEEGAFPLI